MEISGVNRLLAFAQELGMREVRGGSRSESTRGSAGSDEARSAIATTDHRSQPSDNGLKVTLSPTASRLAESLLPTSEDEAPPAGNAKLTFAARNTTAALEAEHKIGDAGNADRAAASPNARRALAAYQRNNNPLQGEQIRIRV